MSAPAVTVTDDCAGTLRIHAEMNDAIIGKHSQAYDAYVRLTEARGIL